MFAGNQQEVVKLKNDRKEWEGGAESWGETQWAQTFANELSNVDLTPDQ